MERRWQYIGWMWRGMLIATATRMTTYVLNGHGEIGLSTRSMKIFPTMSFSCGRLPGTCYPRQRKNKYWQRVFSVITNTLKKVESSTRNTGSSTSSTKPKHTEKVYWVLRLNARSVTITSMIRLNKKIIIRCWHFLIIPKKKVTKEMY